MAQFEQLWFKKADENKDKYILCQICGKSLKSFGRHLSDKHNTTIDFYKNSFPLSPTICEEVSEHMSNKAKENIKSLSNRELKKFKKRLKHQKGIKHPYENFHRQRYLFVKDEKILVKCDFCNKEYKLRKDRIIKLVHHFCSRNCRKLFYDNKEMKKLSREELFKSYNEEKLSQAQIAKKYKLTRTDIQRLMIIYEIPRRKGEWKLVLMKDERGKKKRKLSEKQIQQAIKLKKEGMTYKELAKKFNVSHMTIASWILHNKCYRSREIGEEIR